MFQAEKYVGELVNIIFLQSNLMTIQSPREIKWYFLTVLSLSFKKGMTDGLEKSES